MTSNTGIMYGLVMKTWTLLVAAYAFQKIEPLFTLNLILLRKRNDKLFMEISVMDRKNFGGFPQEILEMIREEVMKSVSMEEEASELLHKSYHCGIAGLDDYGRPANHTHISKQKGWTELLHPDDCEDCRELVSDGDFDLPYQSQFLNYYGLKRSPSSMIGQPEFDNVNGFQSSVAVPIATESFENDSDRYRGRLSTTFKEFSKSTLEIDYVTANRKLIQLVNDWSWKLYEPKISASVSSSKVRGGVKILENEDEAEVRGKEVQQKLGRIIPKWFIWNTTYPYHSVRYTWSRV